MSLAVPHPLQSAALWRPEHPLLVADDGVVTAAQLRDRVAAAAAALRASGVTPSDVVAVSGEPSTELVVLLHAIGWLGATALPISASTPQAERDRRVAAAGARLLVRPGLEIVEARDAGSGARDAGSGARDTGSGSRDAGSGSRQAESGTAPERFWPLDERRFLIATSGSSGTPKLVPLSTAQLVFSAFGSAVRLGHDPADRWLCALPLDHVGGLSVLVRSLFYGTTAVVQERFDAPRVAAALDSGEVSLVSLVPALLGRVLDARPARPFPARLRAILLGGAAADATLLERCRELGANVCLTWGMTEAASPVATCEPGVFDGTCGAPLSFARVEAGEGGVLHVRGPLVGGSLTTADRGELRGGRVVVHGRVDDVINCGGTKVDPQTVAGVLLRHPAVAEACVVALPDAQLGEAPAALLVARGAPVPAEVLVAHCSTELPHAMRPRRLLWVEALPLDATGKPSRRLAKARLLGQVEEQ